MMFRMFKCLLVGGIKGFKGEKMIYIYSPNSRFILEREAAKKVIFLMAVSLRGAGGVKDFFWGLFFIC